MGKRCPACRKPVSADAVICTNCGYDRRSRGRIIIRSDRPEDSPPSPWAWSPAALAAALLLFWIAFFAAATKDPALLPAYRVAALGSAAAAAGVMLIALIRSGMDWEEWALLIYAPEYFLLRAEFEGYTQIVLLTSILAAFGIPFLTMTHAAARGVGP